MASYLRTSIDQDGAGSSGTYVDNNTNKNTQGSSYKDLSDSLTKIEKQYSTYYVEPKLDLPASLGAEKLNYSLPTSDDLLAQAKTALESKYSTKASDIRTSSKKNSNSISDKINQAELNAYFKAKNLLSEMEDSKKTVRSNALKRGLARSSIADSAVADTEQRYNAERDGVIEQKNANVSFFKQQLAQIQSLTKDALEALSENKTYEAAALAQELLTNALKKQDDVQKYNNSLDSNDAKFEARKKSLEDAAMTNEYRRALEAQKLLATVGEEGLAKIVQREKYFAVIDYIDKLTRDEAAELLDKRNDLSESLGNYYDWVVDYVNNKK